MQKRRSHLCATDPHVRPSSAIKYNGSEKYANVLMAANPDYADVVKFDAGIVLNIPTITTPRTNVSNVRWGNLTTT